jgi:bile acid:Na+ symporter, BASS family
MHLTLGLGAVLLFLVTLMFLVGLEASAREVGVTLTHYGLLARALVLNLVIVPILAVLVVTWVGLPPVIAVGVLLMAASPGVPFLPRVAAVAKGNVAFGVGLMIVLQLASIVTTPITLNLILPAAAAVRVPVARVLVTLVLFQLLPLALGMIVQSRSEPLARRLAGPVKALSTLGLLGTIVLFIGPHLDVLAEVAGGGALLSMLLLVVLAWPLGLRLGGPDAGIRKTLAIGTSLRNIGLCLLIATQDFPETGVAAAVGAYFLIQAIANFGYAKYLGRAVSGAAAAVGPR